MVTVLVIRLFPFPRLVIYEWWSPSTRSSQNIKPDFIDFIVWLNGRNSSGRRDGRCKGPVTRPRLRCAGPTSRLPAAHATTPPVSGLAFKARATARREVLRMRPTTRGEEAFFKGHRGLIGQEIAAGRSPAQLAVMGSLAGGRPSRTSREPGPSSRDCRPA